MLLEIPNISRNELNIQSNIISKPFRKLIDSADQNLFNGPPEQSREYVVYASRALYHGDWRQAVDYIFGATKIWKLIPNLEEVKNTLVTKIKEVAFKVLMFRSSKAYENFSITDLGKLFDLTESEIKILASKMIVRDKLEIKISLKENLVQMHETPKRKMQILAGILAEKHNFLTEQNIKIENYLKEEKFGKQNGHRNNSKSRKTAEG